ncbi:MAG: GNAT family N-acetyltransferase [Nanoarchaeota archaeon]|nr:GNAT family N-acetyltransferase [Nanoarchaeota archaeon]
MKTALKGARINLRDLRKTDAQSLQKYANGRTVSRFIPNFPYPYKLKDAEKFIKLTKSKLHKKAYHEFGIEDKDTGEIIGMMSINRINQVNKNAEIGYWIAKSYRGKGLGKESLRIIIDYAFKELGLHRLYIRCFHVNKASASLAKSGGFKYEGRLRESVFKDGKWFDDLYFGLLRKEYKR